MRPTPRAARGAGRTRTSRPPSSSESTAPSGSRGSATNSHRPISSPPRTVRTAATPPARRSPRFGASAARQRPRRPAEAAVFDQGATSEVTKTMRRAAFVSFRVTDEGAAAGIAGVRRAGAASSDDAPPTAETTSMRTSVPGLGNERRRRVARRGAVVSPPSGADPSRARLRARASRPLSAMGAKTLGVALGGDDEPRRPRTRWRRRRRQARARRRRRCDGVAPRRAPPPPIRLQARRDGNAVRDDVVRRGRGMNPEGVGTVPRVRVRNGLP